MDRLSGFITKHYKIWLVIFLVLLAPAILWETAIQRFYYNIAKSLPSTLESNVANEKLEEDFDMSVTSHGYDG